MHVRGQIREIVRKLLELQPAIAQKVFCDSDEVPETSELPIAVVTLGSEEISHETIGPRSTLNRQLGLAIDIIHSARTDALLEAEETVAGIEAAMATSSELMGLTRSFFLQGIEVTRDSEGSSTAVQMRLQWLVTYATNETDPTVST